MRTRCVEPSIRTWITITDRERISRWGRIGPSPDLSSRRKWDQSWVCPRSVDSTTAMNDASPETQRSLPSLIGVETKNVGLGQLIRGHLQASPAIVGPSKIE